MTWIAYLMWFLFQSHGPHFTSFLCCYLQETFWTDTCFQRSYIYFVLMEMLLTPLRWLASRTAVDALSKFLTGKLLLLLTRSEKKIKRLLKSKYLLRIDQRLTVPHLISCSIKFSVFYIFILYIFIIHWTMPAFLGECMLQYSWGNLRWVQRTTHWEQPCSGLVGDFLISHFG